jgi:hypothetical protein
VGLVTLSQGLQVEIPFFAPAPFPAYLRLVGQLLARARVRVGGFLELFVLYHQ